MAQVFRDLCLEVYRERGTAGLMSMWVVTFFDLLKTATEERLDTLPLPTHQFVLPLGGWSAIAGGLLTIVFAFTHASPNYIEWTLRLKWIWPSLGFLYLVATIGLGAYQRGQHNSVGAGQVIALAGALVMTVSGFYIYSLTRIWISFRDGLVVGAVGFLVMGLFHREGDFPPTAKKASASPWSIYFINCPVCACRLYGLSLQGGYNSVRSIDGIVLGRHRLSSTHRPRWTRSGAFKGG